MDTVYSMQSKDNHSWIDWLHIVLIGISMPFLLFPSSKFIWIILILPLPWFLRWKFKKYFFERTPLDWPIFILLIQVFLTCLIVQELSFSLPKIAGIILGIVTYYSITSLLNSENLIRVGVITFLCGGVFLSLIGILGMIRLDGKFLSEIFKISNLIPKINFNLPGAEQGFHPNALGGSLILFVPIFLFFSSFHLKNKQEQQNKKKYLYLFLYLFGLGITSLVLVLTQSRGSWIGLFLSVLILARFGWKKKIYFLILMLIFIIGFFALVGFDKIPNSAVEAKTKFLTRIALWKTTIKIIKYNPLSGLGMNRFRKLPFDGSSGVHAHNSLLHTGVELGIPGMIAHLSILLGIGYLCLSTIKLSKNEFIKVATFGLGGGQLALFIFGFGDSIPLGAKTGIFFWISSGLILSIYHFTVKNHQNEKL